MQLLEKMNVLVVDDQEIMRKSVCTMLGFFGASEIFSAGNGAGALKILKQEKIDLVISDWEMPTINGLRLLQTIRSDDSLKKTSFIMLTASNEKESVLSAVRQGVNDYIVKPVRVETLAEKIKSVLDPDPPLELDVYHVNIGEYHQKRKDLDKAIQNYDQALKHNPDNENAKLLMAEAREEKGSDSS